MFSGCFTSLFALLWMFQHLNVLFRVRGPKLNTVLECSAHRVESSSLQTPTLGNGNMPALNITSGQHSILAFGGLGGLSQLRQIHRQDWQIGFETCNVMEAHAVPCAATVAVQPAVSERAALRLHGSCKFHP